MKCLYFCLFLFYVVNLTYCIYNPEDLTVKPLTVKKTSWRKPALTPQEVEMHHGYSRVERIIPQKTTYQPSNRQPKIDPQWQNSVPLENKSEPIEYDNEELEERPEQQIRKEETTTQTTKYRGLEKMDLIEDKRDPVVRIGSRNKLDEEVIQIDGRLAPMEDSIQIHDKLDKLDTSSSEIKETKLNYTPSTGLSNIPLPEGEINVFGFHYPPRDYEVYPFKKEPKPYANMAFEKCPKMVTGQLVFFWSCSQYLNCYKGRGFISNCAPGTLFNPETLECDFPEKVTCITGTHNQQVKSEKLIATPNNRDLTCPKEFSGLMAHPNDCTKFLNCNSGSTYVQTCGPGTVFNPKISACDHPYNTNCNIEVLEIPSVDENSQDHGSYFDLRSTSGKQYSFGNLSGGSNYDLVVGETKHHGSYQAGTDRHFHIYSSQARSTNPQISSSGISNFGQVMSQKPAQYTQASGCQSSGCQQVSGCQSSGCQQLSGNQQLQFSHGNRSSFGQTGFLASNCQQGRRCSSQTGSQEGSNFDKIMTPSDKITCPPLEILQSAASSYSSQYVSTSGTQNIHTSGAVEGSGSIKCPPGQTGLVAHPFICEKFLNCANGRTHIQDCGTGTVFNPKIQACDWPSNVNCKTQKEKQNFSNYQSHGSKASGRHSSGREVEFTSQRSAASQQHLAFANLPQECIEMYQGKTVQRGHPSQGFSSRGYGKAQPIPTWVPQGPTQRPYGSRQSPSGFSPTYTYTGGTYPTSYSHHVPQYIPQRPIATTPRVTYSMSSSVSHGHGGKTHIPDGRPTYSMTHSVSSSRGHVPVYTNGHSIGSGQPMTPYGPIIPSVPLYYGTHTVTTGQKIPPRSGGHHRVTIHGSPTSPKETPGSFPREYDDRGKVPLSPQGFGGQSNCQGCPQRGYGCQGCPRSSSALPQRGFDDQQKVPVHFGGGQKIPIDSQGYGGQPNCQGCPQKGHAACQGCLDDGQHKVPIYFGSRQPPVSPNPIGGQTGLGLQGFGGQPNCQGCPQRGYGCQGCPGSSSASPQEGFDGQQRVPINFGGGQNFPTGSQGYGGQPNCQGCPQRGQTACQGCPDDGQHKVPIYIGSGQSPVSPNPKGGQPGFGSQSFGRQPNCQECPQRGQASCQGCPNMPIYPGSGQPSTSPNPKGGQPGDFGALPNCQGCPQRGLGCQGCPEVPVYFGTGQPQMPPNPKGFDQNPAGSDVDRHKVPFDFGSGQPNFPDRGYESPKPSVDYEDFEGMSKIPIPDYIPATTTPSPTYSIHTFYVKPQPDLLPPHLPPENRTIYIRPTIPNIQNHNYPGKRDSIPTYSHTNPHTPVFLQPENPTESRFSPLTTTPKTSIHVQRIPPRGTNSSRVPNWPPPFPSTDIGADYNFDENDNPTTTETYISTQKYWKTSNFCGDDQFECGIRDCIPRNWVCNGVQDCPNGADEKNCTIYLTHFTLIPNSRLFKHELEKWLNTDLDTCSNYCMNSKVFQCKSFNYRRDDKVCLLCDTNVGLSGALAPSPQYDYYELKDFTVNCSNRYECSNKKCIDFNQVCDGKNDCGNRHDEKNCDPTTIGYEIRLAGSHNPNEGRIEIKVFDEWGYICDDQFGLRDAHVACQELGYHLGALEVKTSSWFAPDIKDNDTYYLMDDVSCLGNETSLRDCDFNGWGVHNCMPQEIVGVICKTPQEKCPENEWQCDTGKECLPVEYVCDGVFDCEDQSDEGTQHCDAPIEVRLANGTSKMEGRVEVKYHGMWGTVCDDDFSDMAARVICRSLGYYGSAIAKKDGAFGPGIGPIWLDQVNCFGNESYIQDCHHWHWGEHNCDHKEDAAVICSKSEDSIFEKKSRDRTEIDLDAINTVPSSETLLPIKCGHRNEDVVDDKINDYSFRVISGSSAKKGEYPWQATIRVKGKSKSAHWCGAVIISNKFLLTAAHCLVGFSKGAYFIRAGDYDVDTQEGSEVEAYIEDFFIHEKFRQGGHMNNDVAVIKLKGNGLRMSKHVQPICLPEKDAVYREGMNCTISGFGSTQTGKSTSSRILRSGWVPIQKQDICKLNSVYGKAITDGMICAGSLDEGVDSCDGDSGGPLACLDKGLFTLYGITSWGQHCGHANKPGVYVKVAYYRDWIDKKIEENS